MAVVLPMLARARHRGGRREQAGSIIPALCTCSCSVQLCQALGTSRNLPLSAEHQHSGGNPAYFCCVEFTPAPSALPRPMYSPGWAATPLRVLCSWLHKGLPGAQWHINILPPIDVPHLSHATLTSVPTQTFQRAWINESIIKTNLICPCMLFVLAITSHMICYLSWKKRNVITQKSEHFNAKIELLLCMCMIKTILFLWCKNHSETIPPPNYQLLSNSKMTWPRKSSW